jgi:hypothetical protein
MKVFTDFHHGDLYYSLCILFEERLGWELYRPIGLDWFNKGFWKIAEPYGNAMDTVNQFLNINKDGYIPYKNLNGQHYVEDDIYYVYDPSHDYYQKAVTLDKFESMNFDIILPTYSSHEHPWINLRNQYSPKSKLISQMGNVYQTSSYQFVLHSVPYNPPSGQQTIYYHQEIDQKLYGYVPPPLNKRSIYSVVNELPYANTFNLYKNSLENVDMKAYGAGTPEGPLSGSKGVAKMMKKANVGWHLKPLDGFGHSALGWFASGRPLIVFMSDIITFGHDAPKLFVPGVTCLDLQAHSFSENKDLINRMLQPEENLAWAERTLHKFNQVINYDKEGRQIKKFLERIL